MKDKILRKRSIKAVYQLVKSILQLRGADVEKRFHEIDSNNSGKLTQDQFFELISNFEPITRGEIRSLWPHLLTNEKSSLLFSELQRVCLHKHGEASYPNAKLFPPKIGDIDRVPRSKHLNSDLDIVKLSLRNKIDYMFEQISHEIHSMDPEETGMIPTDKFKTIITELSILLTDEELKDIIKMFDPENTGSIKYLPFLKPYLHRRYIPKSGNELKGLLPKPEFISTRLLRHHGSMGQELRNIQEVFKDIVSQKQISRLELRQLQRAMRNADKCGNGELDVDKFRLLLRAGTGVRLSDEQVYQLLASLDPKLNGTIPYDVILDLFENSLRESAGTLRAKTAPEIIRSDANLPIKNTDA